METMILLAVAGALLVIGPVTRWVIDRRRQRGVLVRALRDRDGGTRPAAVEMVVAQGLADRYGGLLAAAARNDPAVRDALRHGFRAAPWQASRGPRAARL